MSQVSTAPIRVVIDTNVLISALLTPGRAPSLVLALVCARRDLVLYDARIVDEYRAVLARPKFASISVERIDAIVSSLVAIGVDLGEPAAWMGEMFDDDDRVFVEVAIAGRADVLLTGNAKHYPRDLAFDVMGPTALLGLLESR